MTKMAIRNAFRKLDASAQADILVDLAAEHAKALSEEDRRDLQEMKRLEKEVSEARPWSEVRSRVVAAKGRKRRNDK